MVKLLFELLFNNFRVFNFTLLKVSFTLRLETSPSPEPEVDDPNTDDLLGGVSDARLVKVSPPTHRAASLD